MNKRVQPFKNDLTERLQFFHIECFDVWANKEIPVIRVEHDGSSFVTIEPYTPEEGAEETLHWETMKQAKYYSLKEFMGF